MKLLRIGALAALCALAAATAHAQVKISDLPAGAALAGTEAVPAVQSANTVKTTPAAINTYVQGQLTSATVIGKWTGTCNGTTVLAGDGTCVSGAGSSSGTFTATYTTGFTTTPTQTFQWYKSGNLVTLTATGQANGTSNAATLKTAAGAAPVAIRPTNGTVVAFQVYGQDNGTQLLVCMQMLADGTIQYGLSGANGSCNINSWTVTGTKVIGQWSSTIGQSWGTYGVP